MTLQRRGRSVGLLDNKRAALQASVDGYVEGTVEEAALRQQLFETLRGYDRRVADLERQVEELEAELRLHGLLEEE